MFVAFDTKFIYVFANCSINYVIYYTLMDPWSVFGCVYLCMYICMYVGMYACMYICMYVYMYVCMYVCRNICMGRVAQSE